MQIEHGSPASARFARENVALYIESVYDGHFDLAQIGKKLPAAYRTLGGAGRVRRGAHPERSRRAGRDLLRSERPAAPARRRAAGLLARLSPARRRTRAPGARDLAEMVRDLPTW